MIVALNRIVVIEEVIRWGKFQIAQLLQCPYSEVRVAVDAEGSQVRVSFGGPGVGNPEIKEPLYSVYSAMVRMAKERLGGLDTRRSA